MQLKRTISYDVPDFDTHLVLSEHSKDMIDPQMMVLLVQQGNCIKEIFLFQHSILNIQ